MALSSDLLSQFAKVTKDETETKKESIVYGTAVEYNGKMYARLDGSDRLTPITTTAGVKAGDRVTVVIKNHSAILTGNVTSPSAGKDDVDGIRDQVDEIGNQITEFEIVIADKVSTTEFDAQVGRIDQLTADNVTIKESLTAAEADIDQLTADNVTIKESLTAAEADIENLTTTKLDASIAEITYATIANLDATNAQIHNLEADYGEFVDLTTVDLTAIKADITTLETEKLSAEQADLKYANVEFTNIGSAAIESFFSKSGMISDLVVGEGTITGKLVGVTIVGDLIEGGTVKADKLVVQGTDGLYYKLNVTGETVAAEQTEYNSLSGSIITAKSITAEKISVNDLVAFGATIGGFHITEDSLYSGVKESIDNTTRGTYMDDDGQFAIGDQSQFLKFYKDTDGSYKLSIQASAIKLGASQTDVEEILNKVEDLESVEVGGRNYFLDSRNGYAFEYTDFEARVSINGNKATVLDGSARGNAYFYPMRMDNQVKNEFMSISLEEVEDAVGQWFTFSFDVRITGSFTGLNLYLNYRTSGGVRTVLYIPVTIDTSAMEQNKWYRFSGSAKVVSSTSVTAQNVVVLGWNTATNGSTAEIRMLKFERGNTATDWTPAPEDNVGGRNYFSRYGQVEGDTDFDENYEITLDTYHDTGSFDQFYNLTVPMSTFVGKTCFLSFDAISPNGNTPVRVYNNNGSPRYQLTPQLSTLNIFSDTWRHQVFEFTVRDNGDGEDYDEEASNKIEIYFPNQTGCRIRNVKLEIGNSPTDWSPAPEDMATSDAVDNAQDTANTAQDIANDVNNRVEITEATIEILKDTISSLVTDENGSSLMEQTSDGWTFNISSIQNAIEAAAEDIVGLTSEVNEQASLIDNVNSLANDIAQKTAYINMTTDDTGAPCIELGKSDNNFKLRITNTSIDFMDGTSKIAYVSNQALFIKQAIIENELSFGSDDSWVWKKRENGNLGLRWIGG